jgi:hypothetical protein
LGFFSYRKGFNSPFRSDKSPDCYFFQGDEGYPIFHDFAAGKGYDWLSALTALYPNKGYHGIVDMVIRDFGLLESDIIYDSYEDPLIVNTPIEMEYQLKR